MEKGKVLVTGGAGYVGSHICFSLLQKGFEVVVFDNFSNSCTEGLRRVEELTSKKICVEPIDVSQLTEVEAGFEKCGPFVGVIHMAGFKAVGESVTKPLLYYQNNLGAVLALLTVMEKFDCNKLIFSSSATVYGDPEILPLPETARLGPVTNPYGRTKLMIEEILKDICVANKKLAVTALRYFNPVGAHPSGRIGEDPVGIPNNLMPLLCQVANGVREHLNVLGSDWPTPDGTGVRDYLHVMDLAEGHVCALSEMHDHGWKTYNLGTGRGVSVLELLHGMEEASGKKIPYKNAPRRLGDISTCYADPSLAEKELKWKATRSLKDMCEDSWNWQKKNPKGYKTTTTESKNL
eukprot:CAMPEP_0201486540 /NCGR_PEP_ID=MMETSP0151_2-20130828/10599_1 /ASSEMBLY_ACC=CAM_ASM_000257 /TAXON_ID=200890 /ORGANISM="Paramoeba atlantica, Strain 621/1 / CCAP 1560/9" /LENGTH=349 /DNA_ID=CAMNT_0047871235 /DNA_START=186 /DNA_END=1235 /DNA_ORIENTATION=+